MIKELFKVLMKESKKARVVHFTDDNSIMIKFESENVDVSLFIDNVKELENHKTVALVKIDGNYRPLYLHDIELIRKSCVSEMYVYEASIQINSYFSYNEIYTDDEINKELNSFTIFSV